MLLIVLACSLLIGSAEAQLQEDCGNYTCVAFGVSRNSNQAEGIVYYDQENINEGNGFNATTSEFRAPEDGFYWIHTSMGSDATTAVDTYTLGTQRLSRVKQTTSINNGLDIVSHGEIFLLSSQCSGVQTLSLLPVYSDSYRQTSMTGFFFNSITDEPLNLFSVALSRSVSCAANNKVPFDTVLFDTSNRWDASTYQYIIPETGAYVFSLQAGSQATFAYSIGLYFSSQPLASVQLGSNNHGNEISSQLVVLDLEQNDPIGIVCNAQYATSYVYGNIEYQTFFSGFQLKPRVPPFIWSVFTQNSISANSQNVPFPIIYINRGGGWNPVKNEYDVIQPGVYYMHITAAVNTSQSCRLELQHNGAAISSVYVSSTSHNGVKVRSAALIKRLNQGDTLWTRVVSGVLYTDSNRLSSFSGFRLFV